MRLTDTSREAWRAVWQDYIGQGARHREQIAHLLLLQPTMSVSELAQRVGISRTAIYRHRRILQRKPYDEKQA